MRKALWCGHAFCGFGGANDLVGCEMVKQCARAWCVFGALWLLCALDCCLLVVVLYIVGAGGRSFVLK